MDRSFFNGLVMSLLGGSAMLLSAAGCDPYERYTGDEFIAGPVDPIKFQMPYLGTGGNAMKGTGTFKPVTAYVGGKKALYYSFPFAAAQAGADDPLALVSDGMTPAAAIGTPK